MFRKVAAGFLAILIANPALTAGPAPKPADPTPTGTIRGIVTVDTRPLAGVELAFVDVESGHVERAVSGPAGAFEAMAQPGRYVITAESNAGLAVGRAPALVAVESGRVAAARVELVALPGARLSGQDAPPAAPAPAAPVEGQPPTPPGSGETPSSPSSTTILHDAIGCFVAGEYPLVDARVEPADKVARARVYFHSGQSNDWFYVEMTPSEAGFVGKLPRPRLEASPITYYILATTTDFGEARTPEISALVVKDKGECDRKVAAIGPPGDVTVFSAATGSSVSPLGFAAGGLAIAAGALLLLAGGAAAVGIAAAVTVFNPEPTPSPSPSPSPSPEPTPTPRPSPSPSPSPSPTPAPTPPPGTPFR
jgi:hypothetical protein